MKPIKKKIGRIDGRSGDQVANLRIKQETSTIKHPPVDAKTQRAIFKNPRGGNDGANQGGARS